MRCLTLHQAYKYFYKNRYTLEELLNKVLIPMQLEKIIKIVPFLGNYSILLDRKGHDYLRDNILVKEIMDSDRGKIRRGYNNLGENNMETRAMNHQVHLNEFVLEAEENIKIINSGTNFDINYDYKDEKQVSKYYYIRPDGLLSLNIVNPDNNKSAFDFFLEMDMSTETAAQLVTKFKRYQDFVKSKEFYARHEKIIVLFIVANTERLNERKRLIRKTLNENFNRYNKRFDVFIGTKNECLTFLFNSIFNKNDPVDIIKKSPLAGELKNILSSSELQLETINIPSYLIRLNNGKIFYYDSYLNSLNSVISKIMYYHHINNEYKIKYKTDIDYLIITSSPLETLCDLEALNILNTKHIYFTTPERLNTMPLYEAIYMYGYDGSISHFADNDFTKLVFEQNLRDKK
jgi:hypothetical protein